MKCVNINFFFSLMIVLFLYLVWKCESFVKTGNEFNQPQSCHNPVGSQCLNYLSTKRPYFYNDSQVHQYQYTPEGCTPVKFWYFGRHGTRNPSDDVILEMQTVLPVLYNEIVSAFQEGRGQLCPEALAKLESWVPRLDLNVSEEYYLVSQGKWEMASIARRYQERFPQLFPNVFDNKTYFFKFTKSERTESSAKSFAKSIFGSEGMENVWFPKPEKNDPLLKFYSACPKWDKEVDKNPAANAEHDYFVLSSVMNQTIRKISVRLGLERNLSVDELTLIYTTCAFETAWDNGTISLWCIPFDLDDFRVLAYREDLEYFWMNGYPYEINYLQACPPFKDLVEFFEGCTTNRESHRRLVQAYFSHSGSTLKMLARLGLFNDSVVIRSDNFHETEDKYSWRSSNIDFMGSNLAFTLYKCSATSPYYQVGFFFQEVPTPFPACRNKAFCSFDEFRTNLATVVGNCDLSEICKV